MSVKLREKKLGSTGMVSLYLDIYHNGERSYEFLSIKVNKARPSSEDREKRTLAQKIRAQREHELIVEGHELQRPKQTKVDLVEWYKDYVKEKANYSQQGKNLRHLEIFLKGKAIGFNKITPEWLRQYSNYLISAVSNNTAREYMIALYCALDDAAKRGLIDENPFVHLDKKEDYIKKEEIFRKAFTFEELAHLSKTACDIHPQVREVFFFCCFTGLRWGDASKLKWEQIITKKIGGQIQYFMYFQQGKTKGIEYIPLSQEAARIIEARKQQALKEKDKSPYVFPEMVGYYKKMWYQLKKWAIAAGLNPKEMHFHASRHTFATNVLEHSEDGDLLTVSKLLGHKSIKSTEIYAHIRDKRLSNAVNALPGLPKSAT